MCVLSSMAARLFIHDLGNGVDERCEGDAATDSLGDSPRELLRELLRELFTEAKGVDSTEAKMSVLLPLSSCRSRAAHLDNSTTFGPQNRQRGSARVQLVRGQCAAALWPLSWDGSPVSCDGV